MKVFKVVNTSKCEDSIWGDDECESVIVTLYHPPYEDDNILNKIKWKRDAVRIKDITPKFEEE